MATVAAAAAGSIALLTATPSFAALPGEGSWQPQNLPAGQEQAGGSNEEVRNHGRLVHVWHGNEGADTGQPNPGNLWANYGLNDANGTPVHIGTSGNVPPARGNGAVAAYNGASFQIFYTGTNNHIYRAGFAPDSPDPSLNNLHTLTWVDTGLQSHVAPDAVQIGGGAARVGLAYVGLDGTLRYIEYDHNQWVNHFNLGGQTNSAAGIAYVPGVMGGSIAIVHTGTDGHVYAADAFANNPTRWNGWTSLGGAVVGQTDVTATPSGTLVLGSRAPSGDVWFSTASVTQTGSLPSVTPHGWVQDSNHWNSPWDVAMSNDANGNAVANVTGNDSNHVYWKEVFRNGS